MMLLRALPTPLLRTLKKTLIRCIKLAYAQDHGSPCPSYLSKVRDLSILPRILQVDMPWWNLKLEQIANLFQQDIEDCRQTLAPRYEDYRCTCYGRSRSEYIAV